MKLKSNQCSVVQNGNKHAFYCMIDNNQVDELNKLCNKDCDKVIEIKQYREKRSLTANGYAFQLMSEIAKLLTSTTEEIYEQMLHDYGVHKYPVCTPKKVAGYKQDYKIVEVLNKLRVETEKGVMVDAVQLKCTTGSSKYDSLQMSQFIEGIKTECDTLGIETMTPDEINRMMANYEGG